MNLDVESFATIEVLVNGRIAELRFNRPEHRNGVTSQMLVEVSDALDALSRREDLAVVVLTGNGSTFCPGADLSRSRADSAGPSELPPPEAYRCAETLHVMPQVTVAAINGACAGAGLAWAAACDLRIAAESARFAVAFLELGLAGELGLVWHLQQQLGPAAARNLLLLPRKWTAAELLELHFLSAVVPDAEFRTEVERMVGELAGRDSGALRLLKRNLLDAQALSLPDYLALETARHQDRFRGPAAQQTRARLAAQAASILDHTKSSAP